MKIILNTAVLLVLAAGISAYAAPSDTVHSFDGTTIYYDVKGEGDVNLVFVHCWSCDRSYWDEQVDYFTDKYRIVTIDLAGHGKSDMIRADYTIANFAKDVKAVVNKLNLDEIILIGHSMGGPVALEAALMMSDKTLGLIGIDTFNDIDKQPTADEFNQIKNYFSTDFYNKTKQYITSMFYPEADSLIIEKVSEDMASAPKKVAMSSIKSLYYYYDIDSFKKLEIPVRSLQGDLFNTDTEVLENNCEDYDIITLEGYGHFLMLENPQLFNEKLNLLIDSIIDN